MKIRDATETDIPALLELSQAMHSESRYRKFNYDPEKVIALMRNLMSGDFGILIVAENSGRIIGGLMAMVIEHFFGHDKSSADFALFVIPSSRGSVAAILLIKEYIRQAKEKGAVDIGIANTTGYESEIVGKFYEKMGFIKVGGNYRLEVLN